MRRNVSDAEGVASQEHSLKTIVQTNTSDSTSMKTLWLVIHDREDPMVLSQTEYSEDEAIEVLKRTLRERLGDDVHVDPPIATEQLGRRYDVHDKDGWLATYWLAEQQVAGDEGMLTAIVSPGARQRGHHTFHKS